MPHVDIGEMVLKDIPPEELGQYATNYRPREVPRSSSAPTRAEGSRRPPKRGEHPRR